MCIIELRILQISKIRTLYLYLAALSVTISWTQNLPDSKVVSGIQAYLSAIIIYLYAHDFQQAQKCYNDCSE
jgi:hypothetical protein